MSHPFLEKFNTDHWSPTALQRHDPADFFQKHLRSRGVSPHYGSPVKIGSSVERGAAAQLIEGMSPSEALRDGMAELDSHTIIPWDVEGDTARLEANRDVLSPMIQHAVDGIAEALSGANRITGQEKLVKHYPGIVLNFLGYLDFAGGGRIAELKVKTSIADGKTKAGRRAGALPNKPDIKHVQQVSYYADVVGVPASLVYVSEKGFRVFDETNTPELTAAAIPNNVAELIAKAWARENLMRAAPDYRTLMQMLPPDFTDWSWRIDPELLKEARMIWGLNG